MFAIGRLFVAHETIRIDTYSKLDVYVFKYMPEFIMGNNNASNRLSDGRRYVAVLRSAKSEAPLSCGRQLDAATVAEIIEQLTILCDTCKEPAPYEVDFITASIDGFSFGSTKHACASHVELTFKDEQRRNKAIRRLAVPMAFSSSREVSLEQVLAECT